MWIYKAVIDGVSYFDRDIYSCVAENCTMFENFEIGNVASGRLDITINPRFMDFSRMSSVNLYIRDTDDPNETWIDKGKYYIAKRVSNKDGTRLTLECYDIMRSFSVPFLVLGLQPEWPMPMDEALSRILTGTGIKLDPRTTINPEYMLDYPNERTIHEVLSDIASAHAGNWIITDIGELRLVTVDAEWLAMNADTNKISMNGATDMLVKRVRDGTVRQYDIALSMMSFEHNNAPFRIDRVTMFWENNEYFTAGTAGNELTVDNSVATQKIVDYVYSRLRGYEHVPYQVSKSFIPPAFELGDTVVINGECLPINGYRIYFSGEIATDLYNPSDDEIEDEFEFKGNMRLAFDRAIKEGAWYYGTRITRKQGIQVARTDGLSEMTLNSDAWEVKVDGQRALYIDYLSSPPKLIFNGELSVKASHELNERITNEVTTINTSMAEMELSITNGFNVKLSQTDQRITNEVSEINTAMSLTDQRITNEVNIINTAIAEMHLTLDGFFTSIRDIQGNLASLSLRATEIELLVGGSSTTNLILNQNQITLQSNDIGLSGRTIKVGDSSSIIGFFGAAPVAKRSSAAPVNGTSVSEAFTLPSSVITNLSVSSQPSSVVTGISVNTSNFSTLNTLVTSINASKQYISSLNTSVVTDISYNTTTFYGGYVVTSVTPSASAQPSSVVTGGSAGYQYSPSSALTSVSFGNLRASIADIRDALISYGLL